MSNNLTKNSPLGIKIPMSLGKTSHCGMCTLHLHTRKAFQQSERGLHFRSHRRTDCDDDGMTLQYNLFGPYPFYNGRNHEINRRVTMAGCSYLWDTKWLRKWSAYRNMILD